MQKYPKHKRFSATIRYENDNASAYSCKDLDLFTHEPDGRAIIEANKEGFMEMGGPNTVNNYRKYISERTQAEKLGKKVLVVDQVTDQLLKDTGLTVKELIEERVKTSGANKKRKST